MDCALKISKISQYRYKIVTLEGEVVNPGGALTGGSIKGRNTNLLGRKREIEEIAHKIDEKKKVYADIMKEGQKLSLELKEIDEEILNNTDLIHSKNIDLTRKQSEIEGLQNDTNKLKKTLENTRSDLERIKEDKQEISEKLNIKENEIRILEDENVTKKNQSVELEELIGVKTLEVSKDESKLTEMKIAKAALDQGIEGKKNDFSRIEKESYDLSGKRDNLVRESKENEKSIIELNFSIKERQKNIEENNTKINVLELNFKDDEIEKEKLKEEFKQKDNLISAVMDEISREEMEVNKREVIKAKKESEEEHIYKKLNEELELTYAEALDICEPVENEEDLKSNISSIKSKITKLGIVNLAAIEEYEELKEKFEFMSNQAEDLEKAKEELIRVIDEMTGEMRILFKENFKILNHNFNETFKDLFQGGSAELILGEGDELSANIDINVEPPGKKLQNINLMSGGEKVLSAIALLFAILKMKPTPFCILDEIEAALDDANVYRYAEFLLRFSNRTQFIVITHRKGTMEASDIIYGVTMEEKGISKVVSVDLSKDDE